jgi:hypothetical protein
MRGPCLEKTCSERHQKYTMNKKAYANTYCDDDSMDFNVPPLIEFELIRLG